MVLFFLSATPCEMLFRMPAICLLCRLPTIPKNLLSSPPPPSSVLYSSSTAFAASSAAGFLNFPTDTANFSNDCLTSGGATPNAVHRRLLQRGTGLLAPAFPP